MGWVGRSRRRQTYPIASLQTGPEWMRVASRFNPITYLVNGERALFSGQFTADVLWGFIAAIGILALGLWVGVAAIRKATR